MSQITKKQALLTLHNIDYWWAKDSTMALCYVIVKLTFQVLLALAVDRKVIIVPIFSDVDMISIESKSDSLRLSY